MKLNATATFSIEIDTNISPELAEKLVREWFDDLTSRAERARDQMGVGARMHPSLRIGERRVERGT
jgi:hypothetical protein